MVDELRVVEEAMVNCADGGAERVGEDIDDEEANPNEGGDSPESTHAKKEQQVLLSCFL